MKDMHNCCSPKRVISPVSVADNTPLVGQIIDRQGYDSLEYLIATGALGDAAATFTVLLEEGDAADLSDASAVADVDLLGTEALASFTQADDDKVFKLGYIGGKRYTRLTLTPSGNATAALISAVAVLGHPALEPTANPPV